MFDVPDDLAAEHADVLAVLPIPLPPAGMRSLRTASARDHRTAESHRKASQVQRTRAHHPRSDRLSRSASLVEARSADLAAMVR